MIYEINTVIMVPAISITIKPSILGTASRTTPLWALPGLVLPNFLVAPDCPLDVANTDGPIVTVLMVFVAIEVEKVSVVCGVTSPKTSSLKNTNANPGAGTWIEQVLSELHWTVCTSRLPMKRPSEAK
jgi:hypothetical protein